LQEIAVLGLAAFLLGPQPAWTGRPQFSGKSLSVQVQDETEHPLLGTTKIRLEKQDGTLVEERNTDQEGRIRFSDLPRARLFVVASRDGYRTARQELGSRQALRDIFISIVLVKSSSLKGKGPSPSQVSVKDLPMPHAAKREHDKGIKYARKGLYEEAAGHFQAAAQLYPQSPTLWNDLGTDYLRLQKPDLAESAFEKALEADKSFAPVLFNLGLLYASQKRFEQAEGVLVQFLGLEPSRWEGYSELGNIHFGMSEFSKAEQDYRQALETRPQGPAEIHVRLANVYLAGRQLPKALQELETYLQLDPSGPFAPRAREVVHKMKADGVPARTP
jgi:tetratricopeptide (TPR) repeat protein